MNTNKQEILSEKQMQDLFCDYIFKKLSEKDMFAFENSIKYYSEINKELEEVSIAFGKLEHSNFDKKISKYTRNLSVKVNEKLSAQHKFSYKFQWLNKYLLPSTGVAAILLIFLFFNFFDNKDNQNNIQTKRNITFTGITQEDVESIEMEKNTDDNYFNLIEKIIPHSAKTQSDLFAIMENNDSDNTLSDVYDGIISEQILQEGLNIGKFGNIKQYDLFNNFENLEEEDIDNILKELENADFNT